jgi:hypothetical protein
MLDGSQKDVTTEIEEMAGPYKDFFGLHKLYKPHELIRDSVKLVFFDKKQKTVLCISEEIEFKPIEVITLQPQPGVEYTELEFNDE